jgi:hypothetical protein
LELITRELQRTKYHIDALDECLAEEIEVILREQTHGLKIAPEVLQKVADKLDLRSSEQHRKFRYLLVQTLIFLKSSLFEWPAAAKVGRFWM